MRELEEDRDHLLRSLEDLDRERAAGDLDEPDYLALKDDYTVRAAAVLRALEGLAGDGAPGADAAEEELPDTAAASQDARTGGGPSGRAWWRPALVAVVLLALAAGSGALVARSAGERLPGDPVSGEIAATGPSSDLGRARDLIGEGRTLDAIKLYDAVLERDPDQPEALAYRGWLLRLAGRAAGNPSLIDTGMEYIERAVAADPDYPDARFFRAFVLYEDRNDPAAAVPDLRAFLAGDPPREMVLVVEDLLRRALAEAEQAPATPTTPPPPDTRPASAPPGSG